MEYNLQKILRNKIINANKELVFVCIGTKEILGDSFGPLVGTYLKENSKFKIYGDIENNICTKRDIKHIYKKIKNKNIIAIDSAVSNTVNIGEIFITNNKCKIGRGINNYKGSIGDITIKAVVAKKEENMYVTIENLKRVDYKFVRNLAETVGQIICNSI